MNKDLCRGFVAKEGDIKTGELPYMSNDEYRKIRAISASDVKTMKESVDRFLFQDKLMRDQSEALIVGTMLHEAILEPEKFRFSSYRVSAKKAGAINSMINNAKVVFSRVLAGSKSEISFVAKDDIFYRKCRPDAYNKDKGILFDVKTTRYGSVDEFTRYDLIKFGYDIQAAWYIDTLQLLGYPANHFIFLVVQNMNPYNVYAISLHQSMIEQGRSKYQHILNKYVDYCDNKLVLDIKTAYSYDFIKNVGGEDNE